MGNPEQESFNLPKTVGLIKGYWSEVWKRKWWIIFTAAVISAAFVIRAWLTPKYYPAHLTFMVNDDEGQGMSGVGAILGELGFASQKGSHNFEKISKIALSRKILSTVLKEKVDYNGKNDYLGNHFIRLYKFQDEWKGDTILEDFTFSEDTLTEARAIRREDVAIEKLSKTLRGQPEQGQPGIIRFEYDDESTILRTTAASKEERFSIIMANVHYQKLSDFYIEKSIERQRVTYDHVKTKTDSVRAAMELAERQLAQLRDQSHGIILNRERLPRMQLERKVEMLYLLYGESVKNLETADFLLKNSTPYFQVIDRPVGPIQAHGRSRLRALIRGGIIGGILSVLFVIGRFWFRTEMAEG